MVKTASEGVRKSVLSAVWVRKRTREFVCPWLLSKERGSRPKSLATGPDLACAGKIAVDGRIVFAGGSLRPGRLRALVALTSIRPVSREWRRVNDLLLLQTGRATGHIYSRRRYKADRADVS